IGAALLGFYEDHADKQRPVAFQSPYLGSGIAADKLDALKKYGPKSRMLESGENISVIAASYLAEGKIIGWMQGRAEFGPRALGNRSILADPRSEIIKDRINAEVKFREAFRPFAPSILHEHGADYFENYQESPYMERTLRFRPAVLDKVPGVVHVDGTGRLQTVKRSWNNAFYELIDAFYRLTGIPLVLNTSFNVMGKPIIHTVEDALAVFYTSGLDVLIIEDIVIEKNAA
ncbi:MAG: carbamoyltransferase, partial [Methylovulum sp.]